MLYFLIALCVVSALVALIPSIVFWIRCLEVERSWATPIPAKGEGHDRAINEAIRRERGRKRIAIPVFVGYVLTMGLTMLLKNVFEVETWPMIAIASIALLIVGIRAMVHNDRSTEQRMKNRYGSH